MKNIVHQTMNLPREVPVMVLHNAALLPNSLLPLRIFEERYRLMLRHCLAGERMFCVALMKAGISEAVRPDDFFQVAGLGLVRACVGNDDGTSHLILQGIARVSLLGFTQEKPFRIAQIRELRSQIPNAIEAEALGAKVIEICRAMKKQGHELPPALERNLAHLPNPEVLSDIVTHAFVQDPFRRQHLLEQLVVSERLRLLIRMFREQLGPE